MKKYAWDFSKNKLFTGQTSVLRPGRPVWRAALRKLTQDRVFSALQELSLIDKAKLSAASTIKTASDELVHLSVLFSGNGQPGKWIFTGSSHVPVEMAARVDELLAQMREAQEKTQSSTEQEASLKAVLKGVAK